MLLPLITLAAAASFAGPGEAAASSASAEETARGLLTRLVEISSDVTAESQTDSTVTMRVVEGDQTIVITTEDGETIATVNGTQVTANRLRKDGGVWVILNQDGGVAHRLPAAIARLGDGNLGVRLREMDVHALDVDNLRRDLRGQFFGGQLVEDHAANPFHVATTAATPPATMLGLHLESPNDVVCAQLGLNADETTVITGVLTGLPAEAGGVQPFDIIIAINGTAPAGPDAIRAATLEAEPGDELGLTVLRRGTPRDLILTLEGWDAARLGGAVVTGRIALEVQDVPFGGMGFAEQDADPENNFFFAPEGGEEGELRIFRGPGRFNFDMPGGMGRVELNPESIQELRGMKDAILSDLQIELRRELPEMMNIIRGEAVEIEPMIRAQIAQLEPMLRQQVIELQPMIREQMQAHGPKIAEAIMLAEQLQGKDPQEIAAIIIQRLNPGGEITAQDAPGRHDAHADHEVVDVHEAHAAPVTIRVRTNEMEDRMDRIEALLQRLIERMEGTGRN